MSRRKTIPAPSVEPGSPADAPVIPASPEAGEAQSYIIVGVDPALVTRSRKRPHQATAVDTAPAPQAPAEPEYDHLKPAPSSQEIAAACRVLLLDYLTGILPAPEAEAMADRAVRALAEPPSSVTMAHADTKLACLITLLRRRQGATLAELVAATGWQAHSVRGALSGTLKNKLGLAVTSEAAEGGRIYRLPAEG